MTELDNPIPDARRPEWTALFGAFRAAAEASDCETFTVGRDPGTVPELEPGRRYVCQVVLPGEREIAYWGPEPFWPVRACLRALQEGAADV